MNSVIFVCLGNICRSPIAEGIAKKTVEQKALHVRVASAGTGGWHVGENPCVNSIKVAGKNGIDISSFVASRITKKELDEYEYIIALDESNYADLKQMGAKNLYKLGSFGYNNEDVPDPYFFNGFEGFDRVYEMIESCVSSMFEELA
ncbi:low molecular weight phosphotyrosine protein phosphatase [bacterium]|nr:low molecular weight phosphotyrosine protein phosphatase [bacterium]MBU1884582.1 low molecular weight phosphotyrosine protein phosphatase [bacterium]